MRLSFNLLVISLLVKTSWGQFDSETYPDPRIDPFRCKMRTVGPVCDPSELLTLNEKEALVRRIKQVYLFRYKSLWTFNLTFNESYIEL